MVVQRSNCILVMKVKNKSSISSTVCTSLQAELHYKPLLATMLTQPPFEHPRVFTKTRPKRARCFGANRVHEFSSHGDMIYAKTIQFFTRGFTSRSRICDTIKIERAGANKLPKSAKIECCPLQFHQFQEITDDDHKRRDTRSLTADQVINGSD